MSKRLSRFLIDKVDERLGDVEKEKVFDIALIITGILTFLAGLLIVCFRFHCNKAAAGFGILLMVLGMYLTYLMAKEYRADCKKAKSE